jgi:CheY-like chemotaxis protein
MDTYLIDDDPIALFLTTQVLNQEGVTSNLRTFSGAAAALAYLLPRLAMEVPMVIFLDLNMPELTGWDFLDALAPHVSALAGRCRIYLLTSSLAQADTARTSAYPLVSGVIHKPLDQDEVQAIWANMREVTYQLVPAANSRGQVA